MSSIRQTGGCCCRPATRRTGTRGGRSCWNERFMGPRGMSSHTLLRCEETGAGRHEAADYILEARRGMEGWRGTDTLQFDPRSQDGCPREPSKRITGAAARPDAPPGDPLRTCKQQGERQSAFQRMRRRGACFLATSAMIDGVRAR